MLKNNFKYLIEGSPIDFLFSTFSKKQLIESYREEASKYGIESRDEFIGALESNHEFITSTVEHFSGEKPHTIRYFSIPRYDYCDMEICALAKIQNNGTTFMFTDNIEFADFISENSGFSFNIRALEK